MKKYIVLIIIPLFLFACKKKSTVHITAKNAVTGKPYAGLTYNIERSVSGSFENHYKTVASGTLDENGEAVITKRFSKNWSHEVSIGSPDNTCYSNKNSFYFSGGENINCDFEFAECAYMQQNIQNVNCDGPNDIFVIRDRYTYTEWTKWSIDLEGCFSNVGGGYSEVPAGTRYFEWKVTRPSGVTTGVDTVVLSPGQNADLTIFY